MPQHSMFPTDPRLTGLRISIEDRTMDLVDGFDVTVAMRRDRQDWQSGHSARYSGVMTDLLASGVEDIVGAWLYGEDTADVLRAAVSNHRIARAHKRRFDLRH